MPSDVMPTDAFDRHPRRANNPRRGYVQTAYVSVGRGLGDGGHVDAAGRFSIFHTDARGVRSPCVPTPLVSLRVGRARAAVSNGQAVSPSTLADR